MINRSKVKEFMPTLDKQERISTFREVELGLSDENAKKEADRCLKCKNPMCVKGCPVGVQIPEFIDCVSNGENDKAYEIISKSNFLPSICGRVCPQEKQCEAKCIRAKTGEPVAIGRLERYVADKAINKNHKIEKNQESTNKKIAIVGSGPSGLTCAGELCKRGYKVDIFEALHSTGGVLSYGIPAFRLPRNVLDTEINKLKNMGVNIINNVVVGKSLSIDDIFDMGYSAVYISTGAGLPKFMNIPGEGLSGVYSANEFLTRINLMNAHNSEYDTPIKIPKKLVVVGGGNVAMDVARCAVRIGIEKVIVMYRRTESEMPARKDEITHAKEENIEFMFLNAPIEFVGEKGKLISMKYVGMKSVGIDDSGREAFKPSYDEVFEMPVDMVVISIGNGANRILSESEKNIEFREDGRILADEFTTRTSRKYVYAGGDAVIGAATVILAMGAGKRAAEEIHKDLSN